MQAREILGFCDVHGLALGSHEGFRVGSPDVEVTGILVTWLPCRAAIAAASAAGCNLLIARDQFNFPPDYSGALIDHHLSDRVTLPRLRAILAANITVFRGHSSLDPLLHAALAAKLELPAPQIAPGGDPMRPLYPIEPVPVLSLAQRAWERLDRGAMRVCGDMTRRVRRVGLLHGNLACAHNPDGLLPLLERGADVILAGELDEYPMRGATDLGIPVIELGHAASLAPGLRHLADLLRSLFPGLCVEYFEPVRPWQAV